MEEVCRKLNKESGKQRHFYQEKENFGFEKI